MKRRQFIHNSLALIGSSLLSLPAKASGNVVPEVRWLGGATLEISFDGLRILTDPCLGEGEEAFVMADPNEMFDLEKGPNIKTHKRLTPFPGLNHDAYDVVLLSHAHEDHFDQKAQSWIPRDIPVLCSEFDEVDLQAKGLRAQKLGHGQTRVFPTLSGRVTVTSVPAHHSLSPQVSGILGTGNGYWIEFDIGGLKRSLYWAGDTFDTPQVLAAIAPFGHPDMFIPHIGAVGTSGSLGQISMSGKQALDFADKINTQNVLPIHHSTYALYLEGVEPIAREFQNREYSFALNILPEGEKIDV